MLNSSNKEKNMHAQKTQPLTSSRHFSMEALQARALVDAVRTVRFPPLGPAAAKPGKCAARMSEVGKACDERTAEEISQYICIALTSWESR